MSLQDRPGMDYLIHTVTIEGSVGGMCGKRNKWGSRELSVRKRPPRAKTRLRCVAAADWIVTRWWRH